MKPMRTSIRILYGTSETLPGQISKTTSWVDIGFKISNVSQWQTLKNGDRIAVAPVKKRFASMESINSSEVWQASQTLSKEIQEYSIWYDSKVNATCIIVIDDVSRPYDIIASPYNVNNENKLMRIKMQRLVKG